MYKRKADGLSPIATAVDSIACGGMAIVVDDPGRENEGDLVMAADLVSAAAINFMMTHGKGLICTPMLSARLDELGIPPMVENGTDPRHTAFRVSVDIAGASTGISAAERAATIGALADPGTSGADLTQPGHVFPLSYRDGGVLERAGHTEASIDLARLAGRSPAAVICEIAGPDGEMLRLPELLAFGAQHGLPVVAISDLVLHLRDPQARVRRVSSADIPLDAGEFEVIGYVDLEDDREHLAIVHGDVANRPGVLVRVHSECLTGDVLGSQRCDCGAQLQLALRRIADAGGGVVVYLRGHQGRGIGLLEKLSAYRLQDAGMDTVDANIALGHAVDSRDYAAGAQILADLGVVRPLLMTNNPAKREGLEAHGFEVGETVPLETLPTAANEGYLDTKRVRMGHSLAAQPCLVSPWEGLPSYPEAA
jgi:3,4-dihydroxy 2-butanone 4-phosphate synthase/GTP cyclohydrolase II